MSNTTYNNFSIRINSNNTPVGWFGGTNKYEYINSVEAQSLPFTSFWYFKVIIYKCIALCTSCGSYNSTAGWGDCTTCEPGYAVS